MTPTQFNRLADRLTKALLTSDFDLYQSVMSLPHQSQPRDGIPYTLNTVDELKTDFDLYHQVLKIHHVTDIFRDVISILPLEDGQFEVTVVTNMMSNAHRVVEPFRTQFTTKPFGDDWRVISLRSSLGHINWSLGRAEIGDDGRFIQTLQRWSDADQPDAEQNDGDKND